MAKLPELKSFTHKELQQIIDTAIELQQQQRDQALSELAQKFSQEAAEHGVELADIIAAQKCMKRIPRSTAAAKYRNPENPNEVWSGRGKEPRWMRTLIEAGRGKNEFMIT